MRYDNCRAQRAWRREHGRPAHRVAYAAVALIVSALWIPALALLGSPAGSSQPLSYAARLHDWAVCAPGMLAGGVVVALVFREHMRQASVRTAALSAILIGLASSLVAGLQFGLVFFYGPFYFLYFWPATVPLSWLSFWAMRTVDSLLLPEGPNSTA
jgi:hypothetical protein